MLRPVPGAGIYEFYDEDPARDVTGELRREIDLLPQIADLARSGRIKLLAHIEATAELLSILMLPSPGESVFHGIEIEKLDSPVEYSRFVTAMPPYLEGSPKEIQAGFFDRLGHPRFLEIRRACGAYQGEGVKVRESQIMDAFHIWCAEFGEATHFLTTDFKLTRVVSTYKKAPLKLKVITPSQFLADMAAEAGDPSGG